jgi:formylmethanofuran dehydrogenase subunit C
MSTLCLTLRERPALPVDLSPLSADHLGGKTPAQIAAIELASGNGTVRLDSLFTLTGGFSTELEIRNACDRLDRIGDGMTHGRILVQGDAGAYLGARMRGGHIEVRGSVGAYAGSGMRGGRIQIEGAAGDFLGGALPGDRHGMTEGMILLNGSAGDRVGDRMRRGTILIAGDAGDYCGSRMVAGTIAVWGRVGRSPGFAMRRGTMLLLQEPGALPPTFNDCGRYPLNFLPLLARSWRGLPGRFGTLPADGLSVRRFVGDRANDGRGEILVLA